MGATMREMQDILRKFIVGHPIIEVGGDRRSTPLVGVRLQ